MKLLALALSVLLLTNCAHLCNPKVKNNIIDNQGRIVIYHGLNVANTSKTDVLRGYQPWQTQEDFNRLNKWGFNLVRYLVFWHALESTEGVISSVYLNNTIEQIKKLRSIGVDVVVDLHQDLYGPSPELQGIGNGFPIWTTNTGGYSFKQQTPWSANYLEPAMLSCYSNFWSDTLLQAKYVEYVKEIYKALDTLPNVIGIDIMNEPFPALPPNTRDLTGKLSIRDVGLAKEVAKDLIKFETKTLPTLYDKIQKMVTANNFKKPIWIEPAIWTSSGIPSILKYEAIKGTVYFPHYYDVQIHESKPYTQFISDVMKVEIKETVLNANRLKAPVLFGEFGAPLQASGYLDYLNDFLALTDAKNIGWTYYTFDKGHPFGVLDANGNETPHMTKLVRVYPQRIAGVNPEYKILNNKFTLCYNHTIDATTEVFIPSNLKVTIKVNGNNVPYTQGLFYWNTKGKTTLTIEW